MRFNCDMDGHCCRKIGHIVYASQQACNAWKEGDDPVDAIVVDLAEFPYTINPDGSCSQLNQGGFCNVYDRRPLVCNTELMHAKYYSSMTEAEYHKQSRLSCDKIHKGFNNG